MPHLHAICVRLAEAGCTPHQIQAITGHDNLAEIETYTKAVSQKRLAQIAMDSLANPKTGLANFDANVLKLLEALALPSGMKPQGTTHGDVARFEGAPVTA